MARFPNSYNFVGFNCPPEYRLIAVSSDVVRVLARDVTRYRPSFVYARECKMLTPAGPT